MARAAVRAGRVCRRRDPAGAVSALTRYFAGDVHALDAIHAEPGGTPFQARVWTALRTIPTGQTISYADSRAASARPRPCVRWGRPTAPTRAAGDSLSPRHRGQCAAGWLRWRARSQGVAASTRGNDAGAAAGQSAVSEPSQSGDAVRRPYHAGNVISTRAVVGATHCVARLRRVSPATRTLLRGR